MALDKGKQVMSHNKNSNDLLHL